MKIKSFRVLFLLIGLLGIMACQKSNKKLQNVEHEQKDSILIKSDQCPEWITIYVHGTITKVGLKLLSKFCKDITYGASGVHHFDCLPCNSLLLKDAQNLQNADGNRFCAKHFYTFGWSGALSFKAREIAGKELYDGVKELLQKYQNQYGKVPKVRIWTFSHGGNVALNMVKLLPFFDDKSVHLELLMVAVPVQKTTEKLIEHDLIAQSYVISSTRDIMQVVDRYKFEKKHYFPKRFFDTSKQNCHQIKVLVNNRGLGHADLLRSFTPHLPSVLNFADGKNGCIDFCVYDSKFRFYNGFNLVPVVRGKQKNCKK